MFCKIKVIVILILCAINILSAQKQDYIWHIGNDQSNSTPEVQAMQVDFSKSSMPSNTEKFDFAVGFDHNNQAISDENGELLFYTNGCAVVNRLHQIMPHGDTLNHSPFKEMTGWDDCTFGYPGTQNIIALDDPANENGYYLLHKTWVEDDNYSGFVFELRTSYVDMSLDNGLGDVVYFDSLLIEDYAVSGYLTAMKHSNQQDWWVIQPLIESEEFATLLINEEGVQRLPNQASNQFFDYWFSGASGTSCFSPDGSKYVYYNRYDNLHLFDFDRDNGLLTNYQYIEVFTAQLDSTDYQYGSVEWSPNSRFMYVTNRDSLHQIDTWEADIESNGIRLIDVYNGVLDPFSTNFHLMTLAPDCKIYMGSTNGSFSIHVINEPNALGVDCNFVQQGIKLPRAIGSANLPLNPRWRVDEDDKCDETITSVFGLDVYYRQDLKVFPNPTTGPITIELPDLKTKARLEIYNMEGQLVLQQDINQYALEVQLNLDNFSSGYYNIELYPETNVDRKYYGTQIVIIE